MVSRQDDWPPRPISSVCATGSTFEGPAPRFISNRAWRSAQATSRRPAFAYAAFSGKYSNFVMKNDRGDRQAKRRLTTFLPLTEALRGRLPVAFIAFHLLGSGVSNHDRFE